MRINETCSCGASFEIEGEPEGGHYWSTHDTRASYPPLAEVVAAWRESHHHTPAPAGVSAAPTSRDSHAEDPAGAPIPTTSEPTCDTCHRLLSCVGTCPKGCEQ